MISKIRGKCAFSRTATGRLKAHLLKRRSGPIVLIFEKPFPRFFEIWL